MKIVLDTNVVVSALLSPEGSCAQILQLVFSGKIEALVDERILREYETVLPRPELHIETHEVAGALRAIKRNAQSVAPVLLPASLPDPKDTPFLEVAAAAGAILITGNVKHFPKRARAGVTVMTPKEFLDSLRGAS